MSNVISPSPIHADSENHLFSKKITDRASPFRKQANLDVSATHPKERINEQTIARRRRPSSIGAQLSDSEAEGGARSLKHASLGEGAPERASRLIKKEEMSRGIVGTSRRTHSKISPEIEGGRGLLTAANSGPATVGEHLMHTTTTIKKIGAAPAPDLNLRIVRDYLSEHGCALMNAAAILGGHAARGRVVLLIEALRSARRLTDQHRRQLAELHDLLMLENVGDPDRIETALFIEIDPDSPVVHELCRLADSVEALLRRIDPGACPDENQAGGGAPLMKVA